VRAQYGEKAAEIMRGGGGVHLGLSLMYEHPVPRVARRLALVAPAAAPVLVVHDDADDVRHDPLRQPLRDVRAGRHVRRRVHLRADT
jgi:hypothetical protein